MALFSSEKSQQSTENGQPPKIDLGVLTALNLSQQDIDSHYKGLAVENNKKEVAVAAATYYKEAISGSISFSDPKPVKLGEVALNPQVQEVSDIPDSLSAQFKKIEGAMQPDDQEHTKIYLQTFATNFGQAALDAKDWQTAVKSFDIATEGGIIQAPNVVKQLGEIYQDDAETRRQIAELIQKRIDALKANPSRSAETTVIPSVSTPSQTSTEAIQPTPAPKIEPKPAPNTAPLTETGQATISQNAEPKATQPFTHTSDTLVQPVGTPSSPILGETNLRPAPPNPNPLAS